MDTNIFSFFFEYLDISKIYTAGWYAAQSFFPFVSGILLMIALGLRSTGTMVKSITDESDWGQVASKTIYVSVGIALYFVIAHVVIELFNALYLTIGREIYIEQLGSKLDEAMELLNAKDTDFSWGDIASVPLVIVVSILYHITYLIFVMVLFATALAHALIVSFLLFWGAVALPISIYQGFDTLKAYSTMWVTVLIWPIIDGFLTYLIAYVFILAMDQSLFELASLTEVDVSYRLTYLTIYTVIHLFLVATMMSSYSLAQGLASGSGDIASSINKFAIAGMAAGAAVGKRAWAGSKTSAAFAGKKAWSASEGKRGQLVDGLKSALGGGSKPSMSDANKPSPSSSMNTPQADQAKRGAVINNQNKS
jgi:hypothetical protein